MTVRISEVTGRTPRTVQEAFGPYTSRHVYDVSIKPRRWAGVASGALCLVVAAYIGFLFYRGV